MTTPRDLLFVALDTDTSGPVPAGDLSLALAGAELIDLLTAPAVRLDGGRVVPGHQPPPADRLLEEAAASLVRAEPFEPVGDFLWRRGESLAETYLAAFEAEGLVVRQGRRPLRKGQWGLADSPSRRHAAERVASAEPVLLTLAEELGILSRPVQDAADVDFAAETVLAAVHGALLELEAERQRRGIEQAAFDNIWRGLE